MSSSQPSIPHFFGARRRSQRVLLQVPVRVSGEDVGGRSFDEGTETLAINANGALILLQAHVSSAAQIKLKHNHTGEEQECHVRHLGPVCKDKAEIGLEFSSPRADFWRVHFPPEDWTPKSPEARKPVFPQQEKETKCAVSVRLSKKD